MRTLSVVVLLAACTPGPAGPPDAATPAPIPPAVERAAAAPEEAATPSAGLPDAPEPTTDQRETTVTVTVTQSGGGVFVEVTSDGWPGRATEPALHVGGARFDAYTHTSPVTLRFVVPDPALVPPGAEASVRYGDQVLASFVMPAPEAR